MAEIVGLAASVAGLIGITGQIGKSALFIKGFLEDTKNAPEEVRSLAIEIELLGAAAEKTDALLSKCQADGLFLDLEDQRRGLVRYVDMIERLKEKIEKDVKTFGAGKGRWWERMGSATKKKGLEGYLVGVERAKTLVLGMETKIIIQLQRHHGDSLVTTKQSVDTLIISSDNSASMIGRIETQTSQLTTWAGTTDQTLAGISNEVQQINANFNSLTSAIQTSQSQSLNAEFPALKAMMESAVMQGLRNHQQELLNSSPQSTPRILPLTAINTDQRETSSLCDNEHLQFGEFAMVRHDKSVFSTQFRTPFFDIDIETKEAQRMTKRDPNASHHESQQFKSKRSQRFTKYSVRVKIPFWRSGMTFQSGNPGIIYGGGTSKSFRTYNVVPYHAPIMKACRSFNLSEVRRLFEAGLASPFDIDPVGSSSLFDNVIYSIAYLDNSQQVPSEAICLLKYLVSCLTGDVGPVRKLYTMLNNLSGRLGKTLVEKDMDAYAEVCRLAINHSSEDPLNGIEDFLDIKLAATPIYKVVTAQDKWWLSDINQYSTLQGGSDTCWLETDLQMLKSPEALDLKAVLVNGLTYIPFHPMLRLENKKGCIHTLLVLASETMEDNFHKCVLRRLIILLEHGYDPREVITSWKGYSYTEKALTHGMDRALSCTEFAKEVNLEDLWRAALIGAGWSYVDIDDLFEEDLWQAIGLLLSGEIQYQTRDEQRRQFIEDLRSGKFVDLDKSALYTFGYENKKCLGLEPYFITNIISEVTAAWKSRSIPGSWRDEQEVKLMPGMDFKVPRSSFHFYDVEHWKCIQEIWETELDGCIPHGYQKRSLKKEDSDDD